MGAVYLEHNRLDDLIGLFPVLFWDVYLRLICTDWVWCVVPFSQKKTHYP